MSFRPTSVLYQCYGCSEADSVRTLHLEVARANTVTQRFYRRLDFQNHTIFNPTGDSHVNRQRRLIADGKTNKEIANALAISECAVKSHLGHLIVCGGNIPSRRTEQSSCERETLLLRGHADQMIAEIRGFMSSRNDAMISP